MIEAIQSLLRLQEIDIALAAAHAELASIPPQRAAAGRERVAEAASVAAALAATAREETNHRALASELRDIEATLEKLNGQLYEITSKNALKALQAEVVRVGEKRSAKEDVVLEALDAIDGANTVVAAARAAAREGEAASAVAEVGWVARETDLSVEIAKLSLARSERSQGLDAAVVRAYDGARSKRLPAVVYTDAKRCPVCQMTIAQQKWIELRAAATLVHCGTCDRILYGEQVASAEAAASGANATA